MARFLLTIIVICAATHDVRGSESIAHSEAADGLKPLDVLVGDWIADPIGSEGAKVTRTISYKWIHDHHFLAGQSSRTAGDKTVAMTITYLWDPENKSPRAWVISSDGAWSEARVETAAGVIRLYSKGVTPDGQTITLTSVLRGTGADTRTEQWQDLKINGQPQPLAPEIRWRRAK